MTILAILVTGILAAVAIYPVSLAVGRRRRAVPVATDAPASVPLVLPDSGPTAAPCSREVARYVLRFDRFQLARHVRLLVNGGEAYPAMLSAIDAATTSVDFETYTLRADATGRRFADSLVRAAGRGVRVRLLYDYIGSLGISRSYVQALLAAGVEVRVYHPLFRKNPLWAINRRDHRKVLVTDRRWSFTGGLNIGDEYAAPPDGGGWRDTHVMLEGDEVAEWIEQLFEYGWRNAAPYPQTATRTDRLKAEVRRHLKMPITLRSMAGGTPILSPALCAPDRVAVRILGNTEFHNRLRIRAAYLHAIDAAQRYILIENAYFIPDGTIRKALERAVQRGVVVGVVVARDGDVPIAACAGRYLYTGLLTAGIRIFEWPRAMMHAKTAVIDDAWALVGSYNMDQRSLFHQLECVAVIADPAFAQRLRQQTLTDIAQCRELKIEEHRLRPWRWRIFEPIAYLLRYWL